MFGKQNYLEEAKKHEVAFRLILDKFKIEHKDLTVEEIHTKYSEGVRFGIWTILNFKRREENIFLFSQEDVAVLSGGGGSDLFKIENGEAIHLSNEEFWMS